MEGGIGNRKGLSWLQQKGWGKPPAPHHPSIHSPVCTHCSQLLCAAVLLLQQTAPCPLKSSLNVIASRKFSLILLPSPARISHPSLYFSSILYILLLTHPQLPTMISCSAFVSQLTSDPLEGSKVSFRQQKFPKPTAVLGTQQGLVSEFG